jgi:uncharacterized protein DUF6113
VTCVTGGAAPARPLGGLVLVAALAVLGALIAVLGTGVRGVTLDMASMRLPTGLLLAVACVGAVAAAGRELAGRGGSLGVVGGWFAVVVWLSAQRSEGDLLLPADGPTYAYLGLCLVIGLIVVALPDPRRDRALPPSAAAPPGR